MDLVQIVFLALLQGLTEFLPISSSAHLILPAQILGWQDQGLAFDIAVHLGTLGAVVCYFRIDLWRMALAWRVSLPLLNQTPMHSQDSRMLWYLLLGTLPAGVAGWLGKDFIATELRATLVVALATIFFGICLYLADRMSHTRPLSTLRARDALIIGAAQILSLIPGTSRSGITITAALALGLDRVAAARFSFLLSIPIIAAAGSLMLLELLEQQAPIDWMALVVGTGVAFVSAYLCIGWFLRLMDRTGLLPFVIYRIILGLVLLLFFV